MTEPLKYRKSRCADCGFTKGTAANLSGVTAIKAQICAEIPETFFCHSNADTSSGQIELVEGKEAVCRGYVETCLDLANAGHYERQPDWMKIYKSEIVEIIHDIERMEFNDKEYGPARYFQERMREHIENYNEGAKK